MDAVEAPYPLVHSMELPHICTEGCHESPADTGSSQVTAAGGAVKTAERIPVTSPMHFACRACLEDCKAGLAQMQARPGCVDAHTHEVLADKLAGMVSRAHQELQQVPASACQCCSLMHLRLASHVPYRPPSVAQVPGHGCQAQVLACSCLAAGHAHTHPMLRAG